MSNFDVTICIVTRGQYMALPGSPTHKHYTKN